MALDVAGIMSQISSAEAEGKDIDSAVYGDTPTYVSDSPEDEEASDGITIEDPETGESGDAVESTPAQVAPSDASQADAKAPESKASDKEVIKTNSGAEVTIDYGDREQIKRDKFLAIGARKWQSERDALQKKFSELEPDYKDAKEFRDTILGAFENKGLEGLVNLLTKNENGYKALLQQELEKEKLYANATPEQRALLDERAANEQLKKELAADRKRREDELARIESEKQKAAKVTEEANETAFREITGTSAKKHSFTGKFQNPDLEEALDTRVWSKVKAELNALPDETDLTPQLMDSLFSKHASVIEKGLKLQVSKETDKVVEDKKVAAQTKVAAQASSQMGKKSSVEEFNNSVGKGDFASAIKMALSGKVKLK